MLKKELAEKMYISLDLICDGEFDFIEDKDYFISSFLSVLKDYILIPTNILGDNK